MSLHRFGFFSESFNSSSSSQCFEAERFALGEKGILERIRCDLRYRGPDSFRIQFKIAQVRYCR
ncbi:hypothetical protein CH380_06335 [Leptospira adleri]|uniref:Uncharacterized protein n=1 Tax=Leptospira adleri TaxID=2023186 RepID=A0A2M9YRH5_9LEPT|nr:hypothetical protein CH380_06335 [Leptospira adleri]